MQLWNSAGLERFQPITPSFYKGCDGIIFAYDMSSKVNGAESFEICIKSIKENRPDAAIVLVGTKNDLEAFVSLDKMKEWSNENSIPFISTSSKTGDGVTEAFMKLLDVIILSKGQSDEKKGVQLKTNKVHEGKK